MPMSQDIYGIFCSITSNVNFDHLVEVVPSRFLHCKAIIFPFAISKYLVERYFETIRIVSHQLYSLKVSVLHLLLHSSLPSEHGGL